MINVKNFMEIMLIHHYVHWCKFFFLNFIIIKILKIILNYINMISFFFVLLNSLIGWYIIWIFFLKNLPFFKELFLDLNSKKNIKL